MYDNHIFCPEYKWLKDTIVDILNGDDTTTEIGALEEYIQELYNSDAMPATQYDDLMRYLQDMV